MMKRQKKTMEKELNKLKKLKNNSFLSEIEKIKERNH
jgi:hypothetical protein